MPYRTGQGRAGHNPPQPERPALRRDSVACPVHEENSQAVDCCCPPDACPVGSVNCTPDRALVQSDNAKVCLPACMRWFELTSLMWLAPTYPTIRPICAAYADPTPDALSSTATHSGGIAPSY